MDAAFLNELSFGRPFWLATLPMAIAAMIALYWAREKRWQAGLQALCAPRLRAANVLVSRRKARWQAVLLIAAIACCLAALARPRAGYTLVESSVPARAGLLLLDVSNSMLALDVSPDRLTRAKLLAQDMLRDNANEEMGLAVFAGEARLLTPPTRDHDLVRKLLWGASRQTVGRGGTNFENALHEALAVLGPLPHHEKFFVLLSDGEDLEGHVEPVLEALKDAGIRGYSAVFGTEEGAPALAKDSSGRPLPIRDAQGRHVITRANPAALAEMARRLGGELVTAAVTWHDGGFSEGSGTFQAPRETFWLPAALAFVFATLHLLLGARRKTPTAPQPRTYPALRRPPPVPNSFFPRPKPENTPAAAKTTRAW